MDSDCRTTGTAADVALADMPTRAARAGDALFLSFPCADMAADLADRAAAEGSSPLARAITQAGLDALGAVAGALSAAGAEGPLRILLDPGSAALHAVVPGTAANAEALADLDARPGGAPPADLEIQLGGAAPGGLPPALFLRSGAAERDLPAIVPPGFGIAPDGWRASETWADPLMDDGPAEPVPSRAEVETVALAFNALLGRSGEVAAQGLNHWAGRLASGELSEAQLFRAFVTAPEFEARYGPLDSLSDRGLVEILFDNMLGRPGAPAGIAHWTERVGEADFTRIDLVRAFTKSGENRDNAPELADLSEVLPGWWGYLDSLDLVAGDDAAGDSAGGGGAGPGEDEAGARDGSGPPQDTGDFGGIDDLADRGRDILGQVGDNLDDVVWFL